MYDDSDSRLFHNRKFSINCIKVASSASECYIVLHSNFVSEYHPNMHIIWNRLNLCLRKIFSNEGRVHWRNRFSHWPRLGKIANANTSFIYTNEFTTESVKNVDLTFSFINDDLTLGLRSHPPFWLIYIIWPKIKPKRCLYFMGSYVNQYPPSYIADCHYDYVTRALWRLILLDIRLFIQ